LVLVVGAVLVYFGVRGLTEGDVDHARAHAAELLRVERRMGIDVETAVQVGSLGHGIVLNLANWTYIWLHWPLLTATLIWLLVRHRAEYVQLRNAMFISGAIGVVIYATFPVAPPRLFSPEFVDTVTQHSYSYRVFQPPALVNKYAAMPSLHVGWNLLAAVAWWRVGRRWWRIAAVAMPLAMAWATVATANHWVLDVFVGAAVALTGLAVERARQRGRDDRSVAPAVGSETRNRARRAAVPRAGAQPSCGEVMQRCDRRVSGPGPTRASPPFAPP
jgi:membrane-associated phospholipid phosphatase